LAQRRGDVRGADAVEVQVHLGPQRLDRRAVRHRGPSALIVSWPGRPAAKSGKSGLL
jgi:hypothetical protein